MIKKFFGCFPKGKEKVEREKYRDVLAVSKDLYISVISDALIPDKQQIVDIIVDCKQEGGDDCGYCIARRLVEAELYPGLCAARVDGGKVGELWKVELSSNPHEFTD